MTAQAHQPPETSTASPQAVSTLRRLKETETAWQKRMDEARARGETKVKYALAARERALADARREAENLVTQRLGEARRQADLEGRRILEEGRAEAAKLGRLSPEQVEAKMDEILATVLGDLRSFTGGKTSSKASGASAR